MYIFIHGLLIVPTDTTKFNYTSSKLRRYYFKKTSITHYIKMEDFKMPGPISFPPGLYANVSGTWTPTYFDSADIYVGGGVPVMAHEPSQLAGAFNLADFTTPSSWGDQSLRNRNLVASLELAQSYAQQMTAGIDVGAINSPGFFA